MGKTTIPSAASTNKGVPIPLNVDGLICLNCPKAAFASIEGNPLYSLLRNTIFLFDANKSTKQKLSHY
jgi:hypothetical protein